MEMITSMNMDIQSIMYFDTAINGKPDSGTPYCVAVTQEGQVFYCEVNEKQEPNGNWRLVNIDVETMHHIH